MVSGRLFVLGQKSIEINEIVFGKLILCCTARLCEVGELVIIMLHWDWSWLDHRNGLCLNHFEIELKQTDINLRFYDDRSCVFNNFGRLRLLWFGLAGLASIPF